MGSGWALDVPAVQAALKRDRIDGWLLYDYRGLNPIAAELTGVARADGHLKTRRWFYLIPAEGDPRGLVHAIERETLAHLPGTTERYARRDELEASLAHLLSSTRRIAMEYSPEGAIPSISRVDAGTIELVRRIGVDVVSSGDLVQRFLTVWDQEAMTSHRAASERLYRVKDSAFAGMSERLASNIRTTEYEIQQDMVDGFRTEGLTSDSAPDVSVGANTGNPHYLPTATLSRSLGRNELVLLDLWGKLDRPGAVYADITWVGYTGSSIPKRFVAAFAAVCSARDAAIALVQTAARSGRELRGWEVDRVASTVLREAGYGDHILHRTGHNLGESVHGSGVNLDDYETHDDRRLLPGTGFTIEPGVYFEDFGVRTEINVIMQAHDAAVTGPLQSQILALA